MKNLQAFILFCSSFLVCFSFASWF